MALATLIAGPTASGKSALAIEHAEMHGAAIINADSMQVYADLAVLSARPEPADMARVPHHLFGVVAAEIEYSVGRYVRDIAPLIAATRSAGKPVVIVGGTGLYFRALVSGLMPAPAIPEAIRDAWRQRAATGDDLHAALRIRDPARARMLHPNDHPRILRAIEVFEATGRPFSVWMAENPGEPLLRNEEWRGVFLAPDPPVLAARIAARFDMMMEGGALDEVARLLAHRPPLSPNLGVMKAHGVPHLAAFLRGDISRDEAVFRAVSDTRAYARRQVIFARRYLPQTVWDWSSSAEEASLWLRQLS